MGRTFPSNPASSLTFAARLSQITRTVLQEKAPEGFTSEDFIHVHDTLLKNLARLNRMSRMTLVSTIGLSQPGNELHRELQVAYQQMFANLDVGASLDEFLTAQAASLKKLKAHGYSLGSDTPFQVLHEVVLRQQLYKIIRDYIGHIEHLVPRSSAQNISFRNILWQRLQPELSAYLDERVRKDNAAPVGDPIVLYRYNKPPQSDDKTDVDEPPILIMHDVDPTAATVTDGLPQWTGDEKLQESESDPAATYYLGLIIKYCVSRKALGQEFLIKKINTFTADEVHKIYEALRCLEDKTVANQERVPLKLPFLHLRLLPPNAIKDSLQKTINFWRICKRAGVPILDYGDVHDESYEDIQWVPIQIGLPDGMTSNGRMAQWPEGMNDDAFKQFIQSGVEYLKTFNGCDGRALNSVYKNLIDQQRVLGEKQEDEDTTLSKAKENIRELAESLGNILSDEEFFNQSGQASQALYQQLESLHGLLTQDEQQVRDCFETGCPDELRDYLKFLQSFLTILQMQRQDSARQIEQWPKEFLARMVYCCEQMGISVSMVSTLRSQRSEALIHRVEEIRQYANQYHLLPPLGEPTLFTFDQKHSQAGDSFFTFPKISNPVQHQARPNQKPPSQRYQTPAQWPTEAIDLVGSNQWWLEQEMQRWLSSGSRVALPKAWPIKSSPVMRQSMSKWIWVGRGNRHLSRQIRQQNIEQEAFVEVVKQWFKEFAYKEEQGIYIWAQRSRKEWQIRKSLEFRASYHPPKASTQREPKQTTKFTLSDEQRRLIRLVKGVLKTGVKDKRGLPTGGFYLGFFDDVTTKQPTDALVQIAAIFLAIRQQNGLLPEQLDLAFYDEQARGQYIERLADIVQLSQNITAYIRSNEDDSELLNLTESNSDKSIEISAEEAGEVEAAKAEEAAKAPAPAPGRR